MTERVGCPVVEVESNVVVPVETASDRREWAARTIRPKLHHHLDPFLVELATTPLDKSSRNLAARGIDLDEALADLGVDASVPAVSGVFRGGTHQARAHLDEFLHDHLDGYARNRRHPHTDAVTHMSMYLHFGHISPVAVALRVLGADADADTSEALIEELVVRRELAHNYVWYESDYDAYGALPEWARNTLSDHADDPRPHLYERRELEGAATEDPYWNAAMREMRLTGYMHNAMRMYWGKKILEWSPNPQVAFRRALYLNNRYFLDGRDPNSYANVAWVFGLHDRPWPERDVYGKVRSMSAAGLERKTDPDAYVRKVDAAAVRLEAG